VRLSSSPARFGDIPVLPCTWLDGRAAKNRTARKRPVPLDHRFIRPHLLRAIKPRVYRNSRFQSVVWSGLLRVAKSFVSSVAAVASVHCRNSNFVSAVSTGAVPPSVDPMRVIDVVGCDDRELRVGTQLDMPHLAPSSSTIVQFAGGVAALAIAAGPGAEPAASKVNQLRLPDLRRNANAHAHGHGRRRNRSLTPKCRLRSLRRFPWELSSGLRIT